MTTSTVTHLDGDSTAVIAVTGPDRWRVPSGPRVAPAVRFPFQPAMATNVLAMLRHRRLMAAVARSIAVSYVRASIGSSDRELVVLRTAWNCRAYFPYSAHLPFAWVLRRADEQAALQQGPDAPSWNGREAALLRAVDELHRDLTLSETTRAALRHHYDDREVQEIAFFVGLYETTSMVFDSMGFLVVQPLWRFVRRAPRDNHDDVQSYAGSGPARPAPGDSAGGGPRLSLSWFPLDPSLAAGLAPHERLFHSLQDLGRRSARASVLSDADRELAILRVAWRVGADGEWRRHADVAAAVGCSPAAIRGTKKSTPATPPTTREEVLLRTVDELHIDRFVSDTTWSEAARFYNDTELIELCALVGIRRLLHVVARAARPGPTLTGTDES